MRPHKQASLNRAQRGLLEIGRERSPASWHLSSGDCDAAPVQHSKDSRYATVGLRTIVAVCDSKVQLSQPPCHLSSGSNDVRVGSRRGCPAASDNVASLHCRVPLLTHRTAQRSLRLRSVRTRAPQSHSPTQLSAQGRCRQLRGRFLSGLGGRRSGRLHPTPTPNRNHRSESVQHTRLRSPRGQYDRRRAAARAGVKCRRTDKGCARALAHHFGAII